MLLRSVSNIHNFSHGFNIVFLVRVCHLANQCDAMQQFTLIKVTFNYIVVNIEQ